ncbi:hypothetical protein H0H92_007591, partial [Tricholoma furcatifolium]
MSSYSASTAQQSPPRRSWLERADSLADAITASYYSSTTALWDDILYGGDASYASSTAQQHQCAEPLPSSSTSLAPSETSKRETGRRMVRPTPASMFSVSPLQLLMGISSAWIIKSLLRKYLAVKSTECQLRVCPGRSVLWIHPFYTLALVLGPIFPLKGQMGYYFAKFSFFQQFGSTCLSSVTFWNAIPIFWLSDADAIKAVHAGRSVFPKDVEA